MLLPPHRLTGLIAAAGLAMVGFFAATAEAAPPSDPTASPASSQVSGQASSQTGKPVPVPRSRPGAKAEPGKAQVQSKVPPKVQPKLRAGAPPAPLAVPGPRTTTVAAPGTGARTGPVPPPPRRAGPTFAMASSTSTSPLDLQALKQALDLAHKNRTDDATGIQGTIADPVARKLVEWAILRSDDSSIDFSRYAAFIAANPSWPSIVTLRRRAEAALWQQNAEPGTVTAFFHGELPYSAKGWFALARALSSQGDRARAQQAVSTAWRDTGFSADLEAQAREQFAGLITPSDDKARMDMRLYAEDDDAGVRAAQHLDALQLAIAKARAGVINKAANAKALLDAVPAAGQRDPGYLFSRIQFLRRNDKVAEAGRMLGTVPHDPAALGDLDQWWVERRVVARKLLDLKDFALAYAVANDATPPLNENYRGEQQFTAGWIALRFLRDPGIALAHFARIADGVVNPITLARSFYWQGRAAEAAGREQDARAYFDTAAHYPTAYYGQLARARLGLDEVTLRPRPAAPADLHALEVARAFEILYAVDQRDMVAIMAADLGDKATDVAALATLGDIAAHHNDARSTLLIGKTALGHGLPLEYYAFPDFGVPEFRQIGPAVERSVVYSIARQESAFNARVVSSANAFGLMQVTPAAARTTAKKFNVEFDQRRLLDDTVYNAQLGAAELGDDINEFHGSYILAIAAYNAGRHRIKEWIDQNGDPRDRNVDPIDWIERIPILGDAQLRPTRGREHAGLSGAHREQPETIDRSRPASRRPGRVALTGRTAAQLPTAA